MKRFVCSLTFLLFVAGFSVFADTYNNPVIPGFYPDPSICRVGEDYYLVTSTFEYFPGVPIFQSKDLVHWRQIGHCLTRNSQLRLGECNPSNGIYAPTIRYHDGTFYLVVTNYASNGNAIFTATDPAGPWSEPIWLWDWNCDPSLLFDNDGTIYYTAGSGSKIYQAVYDPVTKDIGTLQIIFETGFAEAPHLYHINNTYYLMLAEGGTGYGHKVTIARNTAPSPWGPFDYYSGNPILTHSDLPDHPIQATGHGDLVQTPDGDWWMVFLGLRPKGGKFTHLGRETFLAPVEWNAQGWPVVNQTGRVELVMDGTGLPVPHPWPDEPERDEFTDTTLKFAWNYLRNPIQSNYSLTQRPGFLRLMGTDVTLNETKSPTFTGQRQTLFECRAKTRLEFNPAVNNEEAGLTVLGNNKNHFDIGVTRINGNRCIFLRKRQDGIDEDFISRQIPDGPVELAVKATDLYYTFYYQLDGEPIRVLGTAMTKLLSREVIGGFTGTYIGIYATGNGSDCTVPADFDWFEIIEGPGETLPSPAVEAGDNMLVAMDMLPAVITGAVSDPENDVSAVAWTLLRDDTEFPNQAVKEAMQMLNRNAYTADPAYTNLLQDWIGTDTRQPGDPLVLTISGLPAGTYSWTSYHHDTQDQTGQFDVTIHDADGPQTISNVDITNGASVPFSNVRKLTAAVESDGSPVSLVFDQRPHTNVSYQFFVMNGFELVKVADSLKVDFGQSGGLVQTGYDAYTASHENFSSFTAQTFSAFGTTVTVNPDWGTAGSVNASVADTTTDFDTPTAHFTTDTVGTYKIRLSATDIPGNPGLPDMMEIRVYTDACEAAANNPNGPYVPPAYDLNDDCRQDLTDFESFALQWLDGKVLSDFAVFASEWLENSGPIYFISPVIYVPITQP